MAFQAGAFQGDAFQIPAQSQNSGGYAYDGPVRSKRELVELKIERMPDVVKEAIISAAVVDDTDKRRRVMEGKIRAENKFMRLYLAILEEYRVAVLEAQLLEAEMAKRRQEDDDMALILLMM